MERQLLRWPKADDAALEQAGIQKHLEDHLLTFRIVSTSTDI